MASTNQNFYLFQGETKKIRVSVVDSTGEPFDLNGSSLEWILYRNIDSTPSIKKTSVSGINVVTPSTSGLFDIYLNQNDTELLPGYYNHEARIVDPSGNQSVVSNGTVEIKFSITNNN